MKKLVALAFGMCLFGATSQAQTVESKFGVDSVKTIQNASIYGEFVKQKNYKDALPAWRYVFNNAPKFQMNTYFNGEKVMLGMYSKTKNVAYIDTLMMVYDQYIKYFGDNAKFPGDYMLGKKGLYLYRFGRKDDKTKKEAYDYMKQSFDSRKHRTYGEVFGTMFQAAGELVDNGQISVEDYVTLYSQNTEVLTALIEKTKKEVYVKIKDAVDNLFFDKGVADCMTLEKLLTAKYNAAPEDAEVLKEISSLLRRAECVDLPLYATIAEKMYQIDPTADAAYSLAVMFMRRQDFDKTEAYFKEAIEKSDDPTSKAEYNVFLSKMKLSKGELREAKRYALEAIKNNPKSGDAYIQLGLAYAQGAKSYGKDSFDHSSVYWVAVDKFIKAKSVDPSVAERANKFIADYSAYFPLKNDGFFRSITPGKVVTIGGWINETTKARFRD